MAKCIFCFEHTDENIENYICADCYSYLPKYKKEIRAILFTKDMKQSLEKEEIIKVRCPFFEDKWNSCSFMNYGKTKVGCIEFGFKNHSSLYNEGCKILKNSNFQRDKINSLKQNNKVHSYLFERIDELLNLFNRSGEVFSLVLLDIDHFKNFNDNYGHLIGDYVLKELSSMLKNGIRPYDLVGRYGGEEFLIIFKRTDKVKASIVLDRIRLNVFDKTFTRDGNTFSISFSGGICDTTELKDGDQGLEALIQLADSRMYLGKKQGRNRVVSES